MNRRVIQIFCMVVGMVLASSCGDECPVEQPYSVRVSVKDKNYLNISQFPQLSPVDENLPFRTLCGNSLLRLVRCIYRSIDQESRRSSLRKVKKRNTPLLFRAYPTVTTNWPYGEI